ncbi:MAG TPA: PAS domain S-box protein, partial [Gemmatimonadaceae bacterium]|nr:PAS domain S-box protein [Gemmatimonadaceae bacterium]
MAREGGDRIDRSPRRTFGLRSRLVTLVVAAIAPFLILIGLVARQHRFNERTNAEARALDHALAVSGHLDGRIGAIETVLLTLAHSVDPSSSARNDELLSGVTGEMPAGFAHFAVTTLDGRSIGSSDTAAPGKLLSMVVPPARSGERSLGFDVQGPAPLFGTSGPLALSIAHTDSMRGVRVVAFIPIEGLRRELSRNISDRDGIVTVVTDKGIVVFRSRDPSRWVATDAGGSDLVRSFQGRKAGTSAVTDLDGRKVFAGFVTSAHLPWLSIVATPQEVAFAKEKEDFWRAVGFGALALTLGVILALTQAAKLIVPLRRIVEDAAILGRGNLSHRSHVRRGTEISALAETFNTMAETLQKRDEALRKSEMRFRAIIENVDDMVAIVDSDTKRRYASPAMTRYLGYSQEELIGTSSFDLIHPDELPTAHSLLRRVLKNPGQTHAGQFRYRHKNGTWRTLDVMVNNLMHLPGVEGIVINLRDVTARKLLESELRQAQKMESVGQLAGGVAHDFNNLLTVINGRIEFLTGSPNLTADQESDIGEIKKAAERAAGLTKQLLAFSRKQLLQPRVVDPNKALEDVEPMLRRLIGEDIQIRIVRGADVGHITADPLQLQQIILNLALNARDAMPGGGLLTVGTRKATVLAHAVDLSSPAPAGQYVALEVTDTGSGMDLETQGRIFEPFFTTKGQGKGTGLGLSTVYGIVKQSGASIEVESLVDKGTTFRIYFQRTETAVSTDSAGESALSANLGTETILLVEDEESVRDLAQRILQSRGYTVLSAQHGGDALQMAAVPGQQIDLVLTDIVMPAMNGRELAEGLRATNPTLPVIFMSGYTDDEIVRRGLLDPNVS